MKIQLVLLCSMLFFSCGNSKNIVAQDKKETAIQDTISAVSNSETTVIVGTKVGTTGPVRDLETMSPVKPDDSLVEINPQLVVTPTSKVSFDHSKWNGLLQQHVSENGIVNYEGFRKDRSDLKAYIGSLSNTLPKESWTKNEKLAYWMNAYNAMTVDLILRNLPLESIKDINKPWDQRLWKLGEKWYNLDEIEHQILRKMDEPRIHFGINCASFSCPTLPNVAFTAANVETQLERLAKQFINDPKRNTISSENVEISKIFKWFAKDFKQDGTLIDFLNQYSDIRVSESAKIRYKEYDWALNN